MQVLPVIVPYTKTTSNLGISCRALRDWLSNNGFPIKSTKEICLENLAFYKLLEHPGMDEWTYRALYNAIVDDDCDRLLLLLDKGANIEAKNRFGNTALIYAAPHGKVECLKVLLDRNANIEAKSCRGRTALIIAARWGRVDCLKLLLHHSAKVDPEVREKYPQYAHLWGRFYSLSHFVFRQNLI